MTPAGTAVLDFERPYHVPDHIGKVHLIVMEAGADVPAAVKALMNSSTRAYGLRGTGGCANMSPEDRENMLEWFGENMAEFEGFLSSGGTREVVDGLLDPMVTEIPALLAAGGKVVTISTVPRVGDLELVEDSRLQISRTDEWGSSVSNFNPGVHMVVVVQSKMGEQLDWDGDVQDYIDLFNEQRRWGWDFGLIAWNGGGVTKTEIKLAARSGWPVILVEGSGRAADEYITALRGGTLDLSLDGEEEPVPYDALRHNIYVVSKNDRFSLKRLLVQLQFIAA